MSIDIVYAGADAMDRYAANYPNFAECRDLGHSWERETIKKYKAAPKARIIAVRPDGSKEETRVCPRCGTRKIYALDSDYRRLDVPPKMEYPEGYLLEKGTGFVGRDERDALRAAHYRLLRRASRNGKKPNLSVVRQAKAAG